tara:strand:- start:182 stop:1141 length:960 start_codon:yes stop_codon:yes gene_type:complete
MVNSSAETWYSRSFEETNRMLHEAKQRARAQCALPLAAAPQETRPATLLKTLHGGWCYGTPEASGIHEECKPVRASVRPTCRVRLPNQQSFLLPRYHDIADPEIVDALAILLQEKSSGAAGDPVFLSLLDLGAGVGQLGHALLARDLRYRYMGYDGAGDVEAFTRGFIRYVDLSLQLSLRRADWVASLAVGEHVPSSNELAVVRNLHAHNCRGIILNWGSIALPGHGHINCHSKQYLLEVFIGLGYRVDHELTMALRQGNPRLLLTRMGNQGTIKFHEAPKEEAGHHWFREDTTIAFRRIVPLHGSGCTTLNGGGSVSA